MGGPDSEREQRKRGRSTGLWLGLAAALLVGAVFVTLVAFPSLTGSVRDEVETPLAPDGEAQLAELGEDEVTRAYFDRLDRTFPSAAQDLRDTLVEALERGAPDGEIGLIVLQSGLDDIYANLDRLSKADIRYFNQLMDLAESELADLSQSGAPYCQGSDLVEYSDLSEQEAYRFVQARVEPGDPLYEFGLEASGILLDAIRDGRSNPKNRAALSRADMSAIQSLGTQLLFDSDITLLLTTEGKSRREMNAALEKVNFCDLGVRLIGRVENLPEPTRERLITAGLDRLRYYGIRRLIWMMSAY